MNRHAAQTNRRRSPVANPKALATLDLSDPNQHRLHALIQRMHLGRWPTLRAIGMRQISGVLYEAAQWNPARKSGRSQFSLIRWRPDGLGLSWRDVPSQSEASRLLAGQGALW